MSASLSIALAATFVWLGMVLAISFLGAPLKFRAPGVTLPLGLGIGRIVFRALNLVEAALAALLVAAVVGCPPSAAATAMAGASVAVLVTQVVMVRPRLTRRTDLVLAGTACDSRSRAHYAYIALEAVKVITLVTCGALLLSR